MNPFVAGAATITAIGTIGGGYWALDETYVRKTAFEEINWSLLKQQIREIRQQMRDNPGDKDLPYDLQDVIDRLCLSFPQDRECEGGRE